MKNEGKKKIHFNIVDVALIVLLALVVGVAGFKIVASNTKEDDTNITDVQKKEFDESKHLRFVVEAEDVDNTICENVQKSEFNHIINSLKFINAYVIDIKAEDANYQLIDDNNNSINLHKQNKKDITFTIDSVYKDELEDELGSFMVGNQEIRVGKSYIVKTKEYELEGKVISAEVLENE